MEFQRHTLHDFEEALSSLQGHVLMMADLTSRGLKKSMECMGSGKRGGYKIVVDDDEQIDAIEKIISRNAMEVLARFHPVAFDLRQVVIAMSCGDIIERVSGEAVQIAKRVCQLSDDPPQHYLQLLQGLWTEPIRLFIDSVRGYRDNVKLARPIRDRELKFGTISRAVETELVRAVEKQPRESSDLINLISIVHHLQAVADEAANIAEGAVLLHDAQDIRHPNNPFHGLDWSIQV